jgi:hypothetical protein
MSYLDANAIDVSEISLGPHSTNPGMIRYCTALLNKDRVKIADIGVVQCPRAVKEFLNAGAKPSTFKVQMKLGDETMRALQRIESKIGKLVRRSLTAAELCGRPVELNPMFREAYPGTFNVKIEKGPGMRATRFFDRRKGAAGRLSANPPEMTYDETLPDGLDQAGYSGEARHLEGASVHAFLELRVWINAGKDCDAITFGVTPTAVQLFVTSLGQAGASGQTGADSSLPVPVNMKRLIELGIADETDCNDDYLSVGVDCDADGLADIDASSDAPAPPRKTARIS